MISKTASEMLRKCSEATILRQNDYKVLIIYNYLDHAYREIDKPSGISPAAEWLKRSSQRKAAKRFGPPHSTM